MRIQSTLTEEVVHGFHFTRTMGAVRREYTSAKSLPRSIQGIASNHHLYSQPDLIWSAESYVQSRSDSGLVVFEGGDQAGKKTQSELLEKKLKAVKIKAKLFSFPDYSTPIGKEINKYLHGKRRFLQ